MKNIRARFICKQQPFLATMINAKNLRELVFSYRYNGRIKTFTNFEALDHFFKNGKKENFVEVQQILAREKYSVKAINDFAYRYGLEFLVKE